MKHARIFLFTAVFATLAEGNEAKPARPDPDAFNLLVYTHHKGEERATIHVCREVEKEGNTNTECEPYDPEHHFFRAGRVVRLRIRNLPLLSRFEVKLEREVTFTPNLPYVRGVSDAAPAQSGGKEAADAGKSLDLSNVKMTEYKEVDDFQADIRAGKLEALQKAALALARQWSIEQSNHPGQVRGDEALIETVTSMIQGKAQPDYPGPSLEAIHSYGETLKTKWQNLSSKPCVEEHLFALRARETDSLVAAVAQFNARVASVKADETTAAATRMRNAAIAFQSIAEAGRGLLVAALASPAFAAQAAKALDTAVKAARTAEEKSKASNKQPEPAAQPQATSQTPTPAQPQASSAMPTPLDAFDRRFNTGRNVNSGSPADAAAALNIIASITAEAGARAASLEKSVNDWDAADRRRSTLPGQVNELMAVIFAQANTIQRDKVSCSEQLVVVKQWTASAAADLVLTEVSGFEPYSLATPGITVAPAKQPAENRNTSHRENRTNVVLSPEEPGEGTRNRQAPPKEAPKSDSKSNDKPEAPKPEPGQKQLPTTIPVGAHRFARANFVSGFAYSWQKTREYGIARVGLKQPDGQPLLFENGGQQFINAPVETRNQPRQYLYYVGLNFYFRERDLHPEAKRRDDWMPGFMIAYGIKEEANFLLGLNWETRLGINFGGGLHLGQVTGLPNQYGVPGEYDLKDATAVTTVKRFSTAPYINVGFDASVFSKVWSVIKPK